MSQGNYSLELHLSQPLPFVGDADAPGFSRANPVSQRAAVLPPLYVYAPVDEVPYLYAVMTKLGITCHFNWYGIQDWQGLQVCFFKRPALNPYQAQVLREAQAMGAQVRSLQECLEEHLNWVEIDLLDAEYLLGIETTSASDSLWRGRIIRAFDVVAACLLLLLALPLMLPVALAIRLESPGPILFRQLRTGLFNREFEIIKFRSMRQDAESGGARWASKGDARVTRVGRFIRKTRIDELPQLLNVLKGDMALIGPRPEREVFIHQLEKCIPFYRFRHMVKPGITGLAQVMYSYGASVEDARQKHRYDLYYIKHRSLWLDLRILWSTARIVLTGQGV